MAKNSIRDYSASASSNTDIQSIDIDENCAASGINNAIREMMADTADFVSGTVGIDVLSLADDDNSAQIKIQAPSAVTTTTTFTLPDGDGDAYQVLKTNGSGTLGWMNVAANPSLIINGAMTVAQRSTSVTNATGNSFKTVDRIRTNVTGGGSINQEQSTDVPSGQGFINSLKTTVNTADSSIAAGDFYALEFPLEGQNVNGVSGFGTSGAKNLTLSFWVKSSVTGDYSVSFQNGVYNVSYVSKYTISSANTWEYKTISITAKTDGTWVTTNAQGARLWFSLGTGSTFSTSNEQTWESANYVHITGTTQWISNSSATFFITGVKLEVGDTATPFVHEDYGTTLRQCYRYYYQVGGTNGYEAVMLASWYSTSVFAGVFYYPVDMRAAPSVSFNGAFQFLGGGGTVGSSISGGGQTNTRNIQLTVSSGSGGTGGKAGVLRANNDTTARVKFDAEL